LRQAVTPSPWLLLLFLEKIISHQSLLRRGNPGTRGNLTSEKQRDGWLFSLLPHDDQPEVLKR
jgi:hypothetical protein